MNSHHTCTGGGQGGGPDARTGTGAPVAQEAPLLGAGAQCHGGHHGNYGPPVPGQEFFLPPPQRVSVGIGLSVSKVHIVYSHCSMPHRLYIIVLPNKRAFFR